MLINFISLLILEVTVRYCCSTRPSPKPRPPRPEWTPDVGNWTVYVRQNCTDDYAELFCLNDGKCWKNQISDVFFVSCDCQPGWYGRRCEYRDAPDSLQSTHLRRIETASLAGGLTLLILLICLVSIGVYVYARRKRYPRTIQDSNSTLSWRCNLDDDSSVAYGRQKSNGTVTSSTFANIGITQLSPRRQSQTHRQIIPYDRDIHQQRSTQRPANLPSANQNGYTHVLQPARGMSDRTDRPSQNLSPGHAFRPIQHREVLWVQQRDLLEGATHQPISALHHSQSMPKSSYHKRASGRNTLPRAAKPNRSDMQLIELSVQESRNYGYVVHEGEYGNQQLRTSPRLAARSVSFHEEPIHRETRSSSRPSPKPRRKLQSQQANTPTINSKIRRSPGQVKRRQRSHNNQRDTEPIDDRGTHETLRDNFDLHISGNNVHGQDTRVMTVVPKLHEQPPDRNRDDILNFNGNTMTPVPLAQIDEASISDELI